MLQAKFVIMTNFHLNIEGKQQICCQSVFCNAVCVLMHCEEINQGFASYSMDATPPRQKSGYVDEAFRYR